MFVSYTLIVLFIFTRSVPVKAVIRERLFEGYYPKNVILIVAKGMTLENVIEARIKEAEDKGSDDSHLLSFETFPCHQVLKNYEHNFLESSLMSSSALFRGKYDLVKGSCQRADSYDDDTIISRAQIVKKSTGLVTTMRLTAPLPATLYGIGHGSGVSECPKLGSENCADASHILVNGKISSRMDVIFGYGRDVLGVDADASDNQTTKCGRFDGRNLIEEWRRGDPNRVYSGSAEEFSNIFFHEGGKYLGTFLDSERNQAKPLIDVVIQAIQVLKLNRNGYMLVVIIDDLDPVNMTLKLSKLVKHVRGVVLPTETLLIVTSDQINLKDNCNEEVYDDAMMNTEVPVNDKTDMKMPMTAKGNTSVELNNSTFTSAKIRFMNPCNHSKTESKLSGIPFYALGTCHKEYQVIENQESLGATLMTVYDRLKFDKERFFEDIYDIFWDDSNYVPSLACHEQILILQLIISTITCYYLL